MVLEVIRAPNFIAREEKGERRSNGRRRWRSWWRCWRRGGRRGGEGGYKGEWERREMWGLKSRRGRRRKLNSGSLKKKQRIG
jgi:hypothetical protein